MPNISFKDLTSGGRTVSLYQKIMFEAEHTYYTSLKMQSTLQGFIAFKILANTCKVSTSKALYIEDYALESLLHCRIHVPVLSLVIICCLFSKCNENPNTWLRSLYNVLLALLSCACTHRNAMKHSIEICLLRGGNKRYSRGVFGFKL